MTWMKLLRNWFWFTIKHQYFQCRIH